MNIEYIAENINDVTAIGNCYQSLKDIIYGNPVKRWVYIGVVFAHMGIKDLGNMCPFCRQVFESKVGLYNHLRHGKCSDRLKSICVKVSRMYKDRLWAKTTKSSRYVIGGKKMIRINVSGMEGFICTYGDYICVAENMMRLLERYRCCT